MEKKKNFLDYLKELDSILVHQEASNWREAIRISCEPLIKQNIVESEYYDSIISNVRRNGPYFVLKDNFAMPHASSRNRVKAVGFSLVTFKSPVYFEGDDRPVRLFLTIASTSAKEHVTLMLPQIVEVFSKQENITKIIAAKNKEEIIAIIESTKFATQTFKDYL